MSTKKSFVLVSAVAVAALSLSALGTSAANADPNPWRTYSATGSDTTQSVLNGLTNGYTKAGTLVRAPGSANTISSWDAYGSATIQTKQLGISFARPATSRDGVGTLSASWNPASHQYLDDAGNLFTLAANDVDFARSSSRLAPLVPAASPMDHLTAVPFARDAISVAIQGTTLTNFTTVQLFDIFSQTNDAAHGVVLTGTGVGGTVKVNGVTVIPELPVTNSGTGKVFLAAIGVGTPGAYVIKGASVHENDATQANTTGDLIPFSAGQWIGQKNGFAPTTFTGTKAATLKLASIDSVQPVLSTVPNLVPGPLFGAVNASGFANVVPVPAIGTYSTDTYLVAPTGHITTGGSGFDMTLQTLLTSTLPGTGTTAPSAIRDFGFIPLTYSAATADWLHSDYTN